MLDVRTTIPPARFPPIPFGVKRRLSAADRRNIRAALSEGPPLLPTDWPDLSTLIAELDRLAGAEVGVA